MMFLTMTTPIGPFSLLGRGEAVVAAGFTGRVDELLPLVHPRLRAPSGADLDRAAQAVAAYFDGDLTAIDQIPVEQYADGAFLQHAWALLRTVPAGAPVTYTRYATVAGRPAAARAAAQACARNAIALLVPCHRVVRTDGSLGGYRWGLDIKRWLLNHERRMAETRS